MSKPRFVVFINSYIELDGANVWTTKDVVQFVADAYDSGMEATIAAMAGPYVEDSRHDSLVDPTMDCQFANLLDFGGEYRKRSRVRKVFDYLTVLYRLLTKVPRNATWYIFMPSHVGVLAATWCCLFGKPFGLNVRGEYPSSGFTGWLHRIFFRRASFIFADGPAVVADLRQSNPNAEAVAPMMEFRPQDLRQKSTYELHSPARVLYAGSINPAKGVFELVRALPQVAKHHDVQLIFAGSGDATCLSNLRAEIAATGQADRVALIGYVGEKSKMAELYSDADIFCLPSYSEGFARVIYEAMGFGVPILCTDFEEGDGKYFLRDRENCLFIAMRDTEDLAERMIELLKDQSLRESLGRRGFQHAQEVFVKFEGVSHGSQVVEAIRAL